MASETPPKHWDWGYWLRHLGRPGLYIGGLDNPYLIRYYLVPRNPFINLYLHKFVRSDEDRARHSHPWYAASLLLKGGYWEHRSDDTWPRWRKSGSIGLLSPRTFHRVELDTEIINNQYVEKPCWTLFMTGPRRGRTWHFKCPKGLVEWRQFVHQNGCGE